MEIENLALAFIRLILVDRMPLFSFKYKRIDHSDIKTCPPQSVVNTLSEYASDNVNSLFPQSV